MTKFYGKVGYAFSEETRPGVYKNRMEEHSYFGDVQKSTVQMIASEATETSKVNTDLRLGNYFSILADPFVYANYSRIRYVEWGGALWAVTAVELREPRLIIRVGGVYNGPKPTVSPGTP